MIPESKPMETMPQENTSTQDVPLLPIKVIEPRSFDTRGPWKVISPENIITNSLKEGELVIDYEHQSSYSSQNGQPAPAAGWILDLFLDAERQFIFAKIRWTEKALTMIKHQEYRYISPSFLTDKANNVTQIIGAGLVNQPAITELPPISAKTSTSGFISGVKHYLGLQPMQAKYAHPIAITHPICKKPQEMSAEPAVAFVQKALEEGKITPAQQRLALICFEKAGDAFHQFINSQTLHNASSANLSKSQHNSVSSLESGIIATLGIDPQLFSQLKT